MDGAVGETASGAVDETAGGAMSGAVGETAGGAGSGTLMRASWAGTRGRRIERGGRARIGDDPGTRVPNRRGGGVPVSVA
ncbi:hypothetical protein GCM10017559_84010 [Streptosporangium longisporum]|uniref:Uncharacterized protein n=1 Tax=Streptosporangium longisporum TaxID=46187 RepID=A0ABP6LKF7_9ACTN